MPATIDKPSFLSPARVAQTLGLHVESVRRLCREGKMPHRKIGRRIYIHPDAITPPVENAPEASGDSTPEA